MKVVSIIICLFLCSCKIYDHYDVDLEFRDVLTKRPVPEARVRFNYNYDFLLNPPSEGHIDLDSGQARFWKIEDGLWNLKIDAKGYDLQYSYLKVDDRPELGRWVRCEMKRQFPLHKRRFIEFRVIKQEEK